MSGKLTWREQIEPLAAALCDGELAAPELAQLEQLLAASPDARRFLLDYLHLHGELYWEQAASAASRATVASELAAERASDVGGTVPGRRSARALWTAAAAAVVLLALMVIRQAVLPRPIAPSPPPALAQAASVGRLVGVLWADPSETVGRGQRLAVGRTLDLRHGLLELHLDGGARLILQGPARFTVTGPSSGRLLEGMLTAWAGTGEQGLRIETPLGAVVDRGTEFGVSVLPEGLCEVHVFEGAVDVVAAGLSARAPQQEAISVRAGDAVCLRSTEGYGPVRVEPVKFGTRRFVRSLPEGGSVAAMRAVVASEPHLLHHYPFEGNCPEQVLRDNRRDLDLMWVVMHGGRGRGTPSYWADGFDDTTNAVQPFRDQVDGNRVGVGLQTEGHFSPPAEMTVEALLCYDGMVQGADAPVAVAVGTRRDAKHCGFLLAAAGRGQLTHLMDADAPWTESNLELAAGHWYYVAATFRSEGEHTRMSVYAADLTLGQDRLRCVLSDVACSGRPAGGLLGIGKGFQEGVAHAYPWPGRLDEVAVYGAVLDQDALQRHLDALMH